jgi:hypothetical protein
MIPALLVEISERGAMYTATEEWFWNRTDNTPAGLVDVGAVTDISVAVFAHVTCPDDG